MGDTVELHRRGFLARGAALTVAVGSAPAALAQGAAPAGGGALPAYVAWKHAPSLIVHTNQTIETRRAAQGASLITDESRLFVRNNIRPPSESILEDRDAWRVEFLGVRGPRTLSLAELKRLGLETVATVLQCSGNGRKYFQERLGAGQQISGTPWTVGAAGCVIWTGVPLRAVVEALGGAVAGARFITGTGGEPLPQNLDPKDAIFERSVPIATLDTVILAWEMNGKPISLAHGGPLRMVVPGYSGVNNIKYVKTVALTPTETDASIQANRYRLHGLGEEGSPRHRSVWEQPVRSWITDPLQSGRAGRQVITGVAFGGVNAVDRVEVSTDGGATWKRAPFVGPDLGRFAWRVFALPVELAPGKYVLASRATDARGNVQPEETPVNGGGYSHNGWRGPSLAIEMT